MRIYARCVKTICEEGVHPKTCADVRVYRWHAYMARTMRTRNASDTLAYDNSKIEKQKRIIKDSLMKY